MNIVLNQPVKDNRRNMSGEEIGKIFVGGVNPMTTPDDFRTYFEKFGPIEDIVLMWDRESNKGKGYGFVKYVNPAVVDVILKNTNHRLDNNKLDCAQCNKREAREAKARGQQNAQMRGNQDEFCSKKLFVGGIAQGVTEGELTEFFSQFGMVDDVSIIKDNGTGNHRGFGFVTFMSEEDADKLSRRHFVELKGKSMELKKATTKPRPGNRPGGFPGQVGPGQPFGGPPGMAGFQGQGGFQDGTFPGANQFNMGQPMGHFGQQGGFQQRGGPGGNPGFAGQQNFNNGFPQQQQQPQQQRGNFGQQGAGPGGYGQQQTYGQQGANQYGQQGTGYNQQQGQYGQQQGQPQYGQQQYGQQGQQPPQQQQQQYGGKPNAAGDSTDAKQTRSGGQQQFNQQQYGGYWQPQDPYNQQQQQPYQNQGNMGNYAQEQSGYGPQRVNVNQQQGSYQAPY